MKHIILNMSFCLLSIAGISQSDSTKINRVNPSDSSQVMLDQIYNRPFIGFKKARTAVGGYVEGNTNYIQEDGLTEGFSMELRRMNIFLYSSISKRIKFLSELEFEHGTEEIAIETAQLDFQFNHMLNFRAGIILPQIGLFNANHDSPNWEIIDRPFSSTMIIPSTLSEVGFGLFGRFYLTSNDIISYNAYVLNGLQDGIIINEENKTFIPAGKSEEMFGEDNNGTPMFNGRIAYSKRKVGEIGFAYYGGVYNAYRIEGEEIMNANSVHLLSADYTIGIGKLQVKGEYVMASIDVASDLAPQYGTGQTGMFTDIIYPIYSGSMLGYENAKIVLTGRFDHVDFNTGVFANNNLPVGDEMTAVTGSISFRPTQTTVYRFNYRHQRTTDILGNPPALLGAIQFGFASYF